MSGCERCGLHVEPSANFCPQCGAWTAREPDPVAAKSISPAPPTTQPSVVAAWCFVAAVLILFLYELNVHSRGGPWTVFVAAEAAGAITAPVAGGSFGLLLGLASRRPEVKWVAATAGLTVTFGLMLVGANSYQQRSASANSPEWDAALVAFLAQNCDFKTPANQALLRAPMQRIVDSTPGVPDAQLLYGAAVWVRRYDNNYHPNECTPPPSSP